MRLAPFERLGTKRAILGGNGKCELIANFSAMILITDHAIIAKKTLAQDLITPESLQPTEVLG